MKVMSKYVSLSSIAVLLVVNNIALDQNKEENVENRLSLMVASISSLPIHIYTYTL